jgi:hypothetical protein
LYASPNIIRVMKLRGMRWMGQTPHMGKMWNACSIWFKNLKGRDHMEAVGIDGRITL